MMEHGNDHDSVGSNSVTNGVRIAEYRRPSNIPNLDGVAIRLSGNLVESLPNLRHEVVALPRPLTVVPNGRVIVFDLGRWVGIESATSRVQPCMRTGLNFVPR